MFTGAISYAVIHVQNCSDTMAIIPPKLTKEELIDKLEKSGLSGEELEKTILAIEEINRLKKEKNAIILGHYYQREAIKYVADFIGDSYDLSKAAKETNADIILFCGVNFMAETAKILNPGKKVILPTLEAGCSLAESITVADVRQLRKKHPDAAVVAYVNTTAQVKAEVDVCVTSANVVKIVSKIPQKKIIFLPDRYMGENIKMELPEKDIYVWNGNCIVHELFKVSDFTLFRQKYRGLRVLAHYECEQPVLQHADMHGGTSDMIRYIQNTDAPAYLLATECGLASTIKEQFPKKAIVGPCNLCPYMKKNTIYNTLEALRTERPQIIIPEEVRLKAYRSLEKMLEMD